MSLIWKEINQLSVCLAQELGDSTKSPNPTTAGDKGCGEDTPLYQTLQTAHPQTPTDPFCVPDPAARNKKKKN